MDRQRQGKSARDKGARGERELANLLRDMWGYDTRRGLTFAHESDMVGLPGIHPEVKRYKDKLNVRAALEQAEREAKIRCDGLPVVFHKKDYCKWRVTTRLETLIQMTRSSWWEDFGYMVEMSLDDFMDLYGFWREQDGDQDS